MTARPLQARLAVMRHSRRAVATALLIAVVYIALYLLLGWLSYARPVLKPAITPWNPQAGLTLALLLVFGPR